MAEIKVLDPNLEREIPSGDHLRIEDHYDDVGALHPDVVEQGSKIHASETGHLLSKIAAMNTVVRSETTPPTDSKEKKTVTVGSRPDGYYHQRRTFRDFSRDTAVDKTLARNLNTEFRVEAAADTPKNNTGETEPKDGESEKSHVEVRSSEAQNTLKEKIISRKPEWVSSATTKAGETIVGFVNTGFLADQRKSDLSDLGNLITEEVAEETKEASSESEADALVKTAESQILGPTSESGQETLEKAGGSAQGSDSDEITVPPVPPSDTANGLENLQAELSALSNNETASVPLSNTNTPDTEEVTPLVKASASVDQGNTSSHELNASVAAALEKPLEVKDTPTVPQAVGKPRRGLLGSLANALLGGKDE